MAHFTRREFLKTGLAAGTLAVSGSLPVSARRGSATDMVTLGRSGVKVTRLAFGTGTINGRVQRDLGQEGFTRLYAMRTIAASGSSRRPSRTGRCTECWASP